MDSSQQTNLGKKTHKVIISQQIVVNRPIKRKYMPNSSSAENRGCLLKALSIQEDYPGICALITKEIRSTSAYQWAWCLKWIMRSSPLASFQWSKMVMRPDLGSQPSFISHINISIQNFFAALIPLRRFSETETDRSRLCSYVVRQPRKYIIASIERKSKCITVRKAYSTSSFKLADAILISQSLHSPG